MENINSKFANLGKNVNKREEKKDNGNGFSIHIEGIGDTTESSENTENKSKQDLEFGAESKLSETDAQSLRELAEDGVNPDFDALSQKGTKEVFELSELQKVGEENPTEEGNLEPVFKGIDLESEDGDIPLLETDIFKSRDESQNTSENGEEEEEEFTLNLGEGLDEEHVIISEDKEEEPVSTETNELGKLEDTTTVMKKFERVLELPKFKGEEKKTDMISFKMQRRHYNDYRNFIIKTGKLVFKLDTPENGIPKNFTYYKDLKVMVNYNPLDAECQKARNIYLEKVKSEVERRVAGQIPQDYKEVTIRESLIENGVIAYSLSEIQEIIEFLYSILGKDTPIKLESGKLVITL